MPWSAGVYTRTDGVRNGSTVCAQEENAGESNTAALCDAREQDLANGINNCIAKDGSNKAGANLPMNGFKHTGAAQGATTGDYMEFDQANAAFQPLNAALTAIAALGFAIPVGTPLDYLGTTAPAGFVLASGRTIGNAASSGTERANADTSALFTLLWGAYSNTICPVSTGRGLSAAADFAANKNITLPDLRGRVTIGKDDMGGTAATRMTSGGSGIDGTTLGASGGAETHALITGELAAHTHGITDPGHTHPITVPTQLAGAGSGTAADWEFQTTGATSSATTDITVNSAGSGTAHQNTQPGWIVNKIIKL